jgi:HEAT repeat protein
MHRRSALVVVLAVPVLTFAGCRTRPAPPDPGALVEKLKSPDETVSGAAALELIRLGEAAVPVLVELLQAPDARHRTLAAQTFWGMGARAAAAAAALGEAVADDDERVSVSAAMALANMGPSAAPAVPHLAKALRDPRSEVRQWAARALGSVGGAAAPALPALERAARLDGVHGPAEDAIRRIRAR